mmetsp:Transcript_5955/g.13541  ORF Transcript_5955/g.13541 Transcript_5955/m.13541 type:complete len:241 (-) Transcript_5955:1863-2585(-)
MVELVLELDPVQTKSVQKCGEGLHRHEHREGEAGPEVDRDKQSNRVGVGHLETDLHDELLPEHLGQLGVGQRQRPQAQVGGSVGDATQNVLDGVDNLVHHHLTEIEVLGVLVVVLRLRVVRHGLVARLLLVLALLKQRLSEQEDGDRRDGEQHQHKLDAALAGVESGGDLDVTRGHEHLDEHVQKGRGRLLPQGAQTGLGAARVVVQHGVGHVHLKLRVALEERHVLVHPGVGAATGPAW